MAGTRDSRTRTRDAAPPDPERRSLITFGLPLLGSLGVAAGTLPRQAKAATEETPDQAPGAPEDAGTLTPHRHAYYRRARY